MRASAPATPTEVLAPRGSCVPGHPGPAQAPWLWCHRPSPRCRRQLFFPRQLLLASLSVTDPNHRPCRVRPDSITNPGAGAQKATFKEAGKYPCGTQDPAPWDSGKQPLSDSLSLHHCGESTLGTVVSGPQQSLINALRATPGAHGHSQAAPHLLPNPPLGGDNMDFGDQNEDKPELDMPAVAFWARGSAWLLMPPRMSKLRNGKHSPQVQNL